MNNAVDDSLPAALARHNIELADDQIALLDRYREILWAWNEKINLTRHTDFEKFVTRDVVDSLSLERFLESGDQVIDVGSGGGVPGIILAIARPDLEMTLSESVGKKARVLADIVGQLGLGIIVAHARAEDLLQQHRYDTLIARAVAPLAKLATWFAPHWDQFSQLLVIKGKSWVEERAEARHRGLMRGLELRRLHSYKTPGTDAENVVLRLRPAPAEGDNNGNVDFSED